MYNSLRFHPFQGRPLFGRRFCHSERQRCKIAVSIPFREDLYSDILKVYYVAYGGHSCFHPFQGRPLFGHGPGYKVRYVLEKVFPSLSGKTSILTVCWHLGILSTLSKVSIPFREDLYSDHITHSDQFTRCGMCFHPFQGRPLFGHKSHAFQPEEDEVSFHPFQGRPLFGRQNNSIL